MFYGFLCSRCCFSMKGTDIIEYRDDVIWNRSSWWQVLLYPPHCTLHARYISQCSSVLFTIAYDTVGIFSNLYSTWRSKATLDTGGITTDRGSFFNICRSVLRARPPYLNLGMGVRRVIRPHIGWGNFPGPKGQNPSKFQIFALSEMLCRTLY
jgi:hypothetical protein